MTMVLARLPRTLACLGLVVFATPISVYGQGSIQVTGLVGLGVALILLFLPSLFAPAPAAPKKRGRTNWEAYRANFDPAWNEVARTRVQRPRGSRPTYRIR